MELGISPIVTSGLIMQLLAGAKLIGKFKRHIYRDKYLQNIPFFHDEYKYKLRKERGEKVVANTDCVCGLNFFGAWNRIVIFQN